VCTSDAGMHLVHPVFAQLFRHNRGGAAFGEPDLGMGMKVLEDLGQLIRIVGNNWQNGYYALSSICVGSGIVALPMSESSSTV
jgi:hypothetical protein